MPIAGRKSPSHDLLQCAAHHFQVVTDVMTSAIIVAAGKGTRMGQEVDKLFIEVAGRPLIVHTWSRFNQAACIDEIILVVREGLQSKFSDFASHHGFRKPFRLVPGGNERQDSVWNGLQALSPAASIVAIQDGARACTPESLIAATIDGARRFGAAVAARRVTDTIKESDDGVTISRNVERSRLWSVQTPQTFRVEIIRKALDAVRRSGSVVTDDTAACELIHQPVKLIESATPNPKLTVPEDVAYIELLLQPS